MCVVDTLFPTHIIWAHHSMQTGWLPTTGIWISLPGGLLQSPGKGSVQAGKLTLHLHPTLHQWATEFGIKNSPAPSRSGRGNSEAYVIHYFQVSSQGSILFSHWLDITLFISSQSLCLFFPWLYWYFLNTPNKSLSLKSLSLCFQSEFKPRRHWA